jgi:hypothetical protein
MHVMNVYEALDYIDRLKTKVPNSNMRNLFLEWCDENEPIYTLHAQYVLYPILRDKYTKQVIGYMNQYGNYFNKNGVMKSLEDYLGVNKDNNNNIVYIELQDMSRNSSAK